MEKPNLLQKPGGLGDTTNLKPLGMAAAAPSTYLNNDISISARRNAYMDDVNRVFSQYNIDVGTYMRAPVNPIPYQPGNITKSQEVTGPAGYNHNGMLPLPGKADDLSDAAYLVGLENTMNPAMRVDVQTLTMLPRQNFLNTQTAETMLGTHDMRMSDDLSMQEKMTESMK